MSKGDFFFTLILIHFLYAISRLIMFLSQCVGNQMASTSRVAPKPILFKFQGVPSKSRFHDDYIEIRATDLKHIDLGEFLRICNRSIEKSAMMSALICSKLVNVASHPMSIQLAELIMSLAQCFDLEERVVKSIIGEVVLDL